VLALFKLQRRFVRGLASSYSVVYQTPSPTHKNISDLGAGVTASYPVDFADAESILPTQKR